MRIQYTSCYSIIQELLKFLAKFGFSDLLGFWYDTLLPQLVCGHMKGQNYMCHKQKKKRINKYVLPALL